jgi:hypothetical protein
MDEPPPTAVSRPTLAERRATPRLEVNGRIQGELESIDLPVRVREIGLGGFSIETPEPVEPGLHVVRFTVQNHWSISLSASSRHSRPFVGMDGTQRHVTGFEYADLKTLETQQVVDALIERLTSVLLFE